MTLPRFTSGQAGKLTFSHLNEAFDRIEKFEPVMPPYRQEIFGRTIIAKIESIQGSGTSAIASIREYALSSIGSATYISVNGGISSKIGSDDYAVPLVFPFPSVNSIVPIFAAISLDGKLHFKTISVEASAPRIGLIQTYVSAQTGRSWVYTLQDAGWNFTTSEFTTFPGSFQAFNGCENAVDNAGAREIGVGTIMPLVGSTGSSSPVAVRKPIKPGTVALCLLTAAGYVFSIPNGYEFDCP